MLYKWPLVTTVFLWSLLNPSGSNFYLHILLHIVMEPKLHVGIVSHPSWVKEDKGWALGTQLCPTHWDRLASLDSLAVPSFSMIIRH